MDSEQPRPSRLAITFVVVGLALSAIGIAYLIYAGRARHLPPLTTPEVDLLVKKQQLDALFRMLLHSFFLFLAFILGSYLMVRIGRRVLYHKPHHARTEYHDAWGNYRLSQDEIDTATANLEEDFPPDATPNDESS